MVIVEDDPMVSLLDRTYTEKDARFQVVQTFQNGQAALEWLSVNPADLVILDVYMPLLTGHELLRELRSRQISVDAIMVTAANDPGTVDALLKMGVVDYLVKPFTCDRFQQALETFCRHRAAVTGEAVSQGALDRLFSPSMPPRSTGPPRAFRRAHWNGSGRVCGPLLPKAWPVRPSPNRRIFRW
ncbi:MAG: response regulator [Dysosmobacter sp.]